MESLRLGNDDGDGEINDISLLAGMVNLKELYLHGNQISDISALAGMKNLETLYLSDNKISDISVLAGLINLKTLNLSENQISDISTLAEISNLESVELAGNQIKDVSALTGKNLWCLDLSYNPLGENAIDVISNIVSIEELYLAGTQLNNEDVEKLANLNRLAGFDFSDNQISDISSLDNIWKYVYLIDLSNNQISDVSVLKGLGGAGARFYLSNNQISDVTPFADSNIHTLDLSNNQISDFTGALGRVYLNLSHNQISDITPLLTCYWGNGIDLSYNQIADISPLKNLKENEDWDIIIWTVNLSNNKITDITPITTNDFFTENTGILDLSNNQISDVTSFANVSRDTSLRKLDLSNNSIRDISALDWLKEIELEGSPQCEIITDGNPIGEPEVPSEPEKPIYAADDFAALIGTQDVVVKPNDYVTITFAQGSKLNDTTGKTEYDFTTTVTTEFANAKLPAFIKENSFITKVSYSYSGVLPASASIQIFVGADYAGKEVFYFLLNDDNTYNSNEVQKVAVNESGYITVTQEHCSDYVVTMENPADLYEEYEGSQKTETDDNTNNSTDDSANQGGQDDNSGTNNENQGAADGSEENDNQNGINNESPKTGDYARIGMLSILMLASILLVLRVKGYKRA